VQNCKCLLKEQTKLRTTHSLSCTSGQLPSRSVGADAWQLTVAQMLNVLVEVPHTT